MRSSFFSVVLGFIGLLHPITEVYAFGGGRWEAIDREELEIDLPKIDPTASAEFTLRRVEVDDSGDRTLFRYHNRVRIYTEDGVEAFRKVDLEYQAGWSLHGIKARVIHSDGTIVKLKGRDFFRRQTFSDDYQQRFSTSFGFPGLKVGCVVEYAWQMSRESGTGGFDIPVLAEWPTWVFSLSLVPNRKLYSRCVSYNSAVAVEKVDKRFNYMDTLLSARAEYPYLAARKNYEPFVYLEYTPHKDMFAEGSYWAYRGGSLIDRNKRFVDADCPMVCALAEELFSGVNTLEAKLRRIYRYCSSEVENVSYYNSKFTEAGLDKLPTNRRPSDTIRNGSGTRYDINALFASLAAQTGYSTGLAQVESRRRFRYDPAAMGAFNLSDWLVSMEVDGGWLFFDPGSPHLPFGVLNAENAGVHALVTDAAYFTIARTPDVGENFSKKTRFATLEMDEAGGVWGKVKVVYTGYAAIWRKRFFDTMALGEQEAFVLKSEWTGRLPQTEIEDFKVTYDERSSGRLIIEYSLGVPQYSDTVGKRTFLNPNVFEVGKLGIFPDEDRSADVAFDYKVKVRDRVTFNLPPTVSYLSSRLADHSFEGDVVGRVSRVDYMEDRNVLAFQNVYALKRLSFASSEYPALKGELDAVRSFDERLVCLVHKNGNE